MMIFNMRQDRLTANRNLRQAFQAAFNRDEYINRIIAVPGNKPSTSLFPSWLDGKQSSFREEYPPPFYRQPDMQEAARLIESAELETKKLTLLTFDGATARKRAEYFQAHFGGHLGLKILIGQQSVKQFHQKLNTGNFDFAIWGWLPDYNDILTYADLFASWNGNNVGAYQNPEHHELVRVIQSSTDPDVRFEAAARIQQIVFDDVVVIPLFETSSANLVSPRLKGMKRNMLAPDPDYIYARVE